MSYTRTLDEYGDGELERELAERDRIHDLGKCTYCRRQRGVEPVCRFPERHNEQPRDTSDRYKKLLRLCEIACHVDIEVNPHSISYQSATEYMRDQAVDFDAEEIVGDIEDSKTLYRVQVYPNTPVGFCVRVGHDLGAIVDNLLPDLEREHARRSES